MSNFKWLACLASAFVLIACGNEPQPDDPPPESPAATEALGELTASHSGGDAVSTVVRGKVTETMDASSYTYVCIDDGSGSEIWAAVPRTNLSVGEEVTVQGGDMVMENFFSSTLNRSFEKIIFATGVSRGPENVASGPDASEIDAGTQGPSEAGVSGGSAANIVPFADLKVEKAFGPNAYSVAELFENASLLDTKKVVVRGQVVKFSGNIMGKNWIHIQDGTGDAANNSHDLVVTTMGEAEKGDIVIVEGMVAADKDFGFGYQYDVIVEDASITRVKETLGEII